MRIAFVLAMAAVALFPAVARADVFDVNSDVPAVLDGRVASTPGTGIVAGIIDHGQVTIYKEGDSGTARALDEHTLFAIGPATQIFTRMLLAEMLHDGDVKPNDAAATYLPRNVSDPWFDGKPMTFASLATWRFGGTGESIGLLGLALANHEKVDYASLVRRRVFQALQMSDSVITTNGKMHVAFAVGHDADGNVVRASRFSDVTASAGAMYASLADMLKYLNCEMGDGPLASVCQSAAQDVSNAEAHAIYANTAGFHLVMMMSGDRSKGVVILSNGPMVIDIAPHLLDSRYPVTSVAPMELDAVQMATYTGVYENRTAGIEKMIVMQRDGKLYVQAAGQSPVRIYASRPDHFYTRVDDGSIEFVHQNGGIVGLILTELGRPIPIFRLGVDGKPLATSLEPAYPPVVPVNAQTLESYAGRYNVSTYLSETVTVNDGHVFLQRTKSDPVEIYPSAKDEFYSKVNDAQMFFVRDESGRVIGFAISRNGNLTFAVKQ